MTENGRGHLRDDALLQIEDLVVEYVVGRHDRVHAVSGVTLDVVKGETLGLVGESGCGKSTVGRSMMMLDRPTAGSVRFEGVELTTVRRVSLRKIRPRLQMIFQDPASSLNPRRTVRQIVSEGLSINRVPKPWTERVDHAIRTVGLDPDVVGGRRPDELSGGQCQRVAIARALVLDPALLVCDEAVSALDVSVQAQILNILEDAKEQYQLTVVFIAHDLAVVANVSDRVAVMYLGKLCEIAPPQVLFQEGLHPYTHGLVSSVPDPDLDKAEPSARVHGELPSPINPPSGCRFRTRCPRADAQCADHEPILRRVADDHFVACHHAGPPDL